MLNDIGVSAQRGRRVPLVESAFEYGSRRGAWRVLEVLHDFCYQGEHPRRRPRARAKSRIGQGAASNAGHEIVSHGYRWIDYGAVAEEVERRHIARAVDILTRLTGTRPVGWMTGRPGPNTRRLLVEAGGLLIRPRFARRRTALLAEYRQPAASRHSLFVRGERQSLQREQRLLHRRGFFHLYARRVRCALPRRQRRRAKAALHRPA